MYSMYKNYENEQHHREGFRMSLYDKKKRIIAMLKPFDYYNPEDVKVSIQELLDFIVIHRAAMNTTTYWKLRDRIDKIFGKELV